jgi:hypothetical protein
MLRIPKDKPEKQPISNGKNYICQLADSSVASANSFVASFRAISAQHGCDVESWSPSPAFNVLTDHRRVRMNGDGDTTKD